jgi:hypothetical protein
MPAISIEQALAIQQGVYYKVYGATTTRKFTGIPSETLFAPGATATLLTATLSLGTPNVTLTQGTTAGMIPGMVITKISGAGDFAAGVDYVYSITSSSAFVVGTDAQVAVNNLEATLNTTTNVVTLTAGTTQRLRLGHLLTKQAGVGAFGNTGIVYVASITGDKTFTVSSDTSGNTPVNHETSGSIVFYAGGVTANKTHGTAGAITFRVGGIDFANEVIYGLGNLPHQTYFLTNPNTTNTNNFLVSSPAPAYLVGGDVNTGGTLQETEASYHWTGCILRKKLK